MIALPSATQALLLALRDIQSTTALSLAQWDRVVRLARQARVLGVLAVRLQADTALWRALPGEVQGHCRAALHITAYRARMAEVAIADLERRLAPQVPLVLLKGAAYLAQGLPLAEGRMIGDVDILVAPAHLNRAEQLLHQQGWMSAVTTAYDDHYYRAWSHELPPLRHPSHVVELDVHHALTPPTSRIHPAMAEVLAQLKPLNRAGVSVLHPHDQILHAVIHVYQDTELDGRLRDLVDIQGLLIAHLSTESEWQALCQRAAMLGATPALEWALHYCVQWLGLDVPASVSVPEPSKWMNWLMHQHCLPHVPEHVPASAWWAARLGQLRYHRYRMPLGLLARHSAHKCVTGLGRWWRPRATA